VGDIEAASRFVVSFDAPRDDNLFGPVVISRSSASWFSSSWDCCPPACCVATESCRDGYPLGPPRAQQAISLTLATAEVLDRDPDLTMD
jgi:hypothetical protein